MDTLTLNHAPVGRLKRTAPMYSNDESVMKAIDALSKDPDVKKEADAMEGKIAKNEIDLSDILYVKDSLLKRFGFTNNQKLMIANDLIFKALLNQSLKGGKFDYDDLEYINLKMKEPFKEYNEILIKAYTDEVINNSGKVLINDQGSTQSDLEKLVKENQALKQENLELTNKNTELDAQKKELLIKNAGLEADVKELTDKILQLENQIQELTKAKTGLESKNAELTNNNTLLNNDNERLKNEHRAIVAEKSILVSEKAILVNEKQILVNEKEMLVKENLELKARLDAIDEIVCSKSTPTEKVALLGELIKKIINKKS